MGKIKIYEIAKKLDLASKQVLDMAQKLKIQVKSQMSSVEESEAEQIEIGLSKNEQNAKQATKQSTAKKEEKAPVIIRREVIISNEDNNKTEKKRQENKNNNIGFVERKQNKDFNKIGRAHV